MTESEQPRIVTDVAPSEHAALVSAAEQLSLAVKEATGASWPVRLRLVGDDQEIPDGAVLVSSLLRDMEGGSPTLAERIARYRAAGHERILICNLFRNVAGRAPATVERIRRLNLMAIEQSRAPGFEIVDVDRLLSLCGARTIGADYRGASPAAARLIGHAIAAVILDGDMDKWMDAVIQHRATAAHGGVRDIQRLIERHVHGISAR